MSEDTGVIDPNAAREVAPGAPHDPSQPDARRAEPAPQSPPAADDGEPAAPAYANPRDAIAKRFQERRATHERRFGGEAQAMGDPPFVEHGEREAAAEPAAAPAQAPAPAEAAPASAAPAGYTLKVRGKDVQVGTRDELLRIAEMEPGEADGLSDATLVKIAQKQAAGLAFIEEGRNFRDQARVAAPAPAAPQAGDPSQQHQPQPAADAPSLADLQRIAIEKTQISTPEEAAEAWQAYHARRDAEARSERDAQSRMASEREVISRHVRDFEQSNPDLGSNPGAMRLLLLAATDEIANDLRGIGVTDEYLRPALNDPQRMADALIQARLAGYSVRSHAELLAAAGAKTREYMRMPAPPGPAQQPSAAVPTRLDEKRGLQAQPTRSGHPTPEPTTAPDQEGSRKRAIEKMIAGRRAPNVPAMAG